MIFIENIKQNEETGYYELECPYCHHVTVLNGDEEPEYCEHVVYGHETVNWELILSDSEWIEKIKPALKLYAANSDLFEKYVMDHLDIDPDEEDEEFRYTDHIEECLDDYIDDGNLSAEMIRDALMVSGRQDISDTLIVDSIIEVADGNGTYYIFDSRSDMKAEDVDLSYITEE